MRKQFRKLIGRAKPEAVATESASTTAPQPSSAAPGEPSLNAPGQQEFLPAPLSVPSQQDVQPASQSALQATVPSATSTDSVSLPLSDLQAQLWNRAYDELKDSEPKLVGEYEKILTLQLHPDKMESQTVETTDNEIGSHQGTRSDQMRELVDKELERRKKQIETKQKVNEGIHVVQELRGIVDKAVKAAPEAAVAWVGVCLGLDILSNTIEEPLKNRDGIIYVLSRMDWYWNLASLLLDKNYATELSEPLREQLKTRLTKLYGALISFQMKSICLYRSTWISVTARDAIKLDDWAGQVDDIKACEKIVKSDMEQYNTQGIKAELHNLSNNSTQSENRLRDICSAIQDQTRKQEERHQSDEDKKFLQDLRVTDPRHDKLRIQSTKGGLLKDSYRWILENHDFRQWRDDDSQSTLLWIKGNPGKGKTMLLCGIIDELEKSPTSLLSYFFCQATDAQLNSSANVLRGLIYLLCEQRPSLISHVRDKYDKAGKSLFQDANAWQALLEIFTAILDVEDLGTPILMVDALDECDDQDRQQLLRLIAKSSSVKWIVSSRHIPDIEATLNQAEHKVRLNLELNETSVSKAVETYINHKVQELSKLKPYDKHTIEVVRRYLFKNAQGTFLWVALVYQRLADPRIIRKKEFLSRLESFPPGLDALYGRMMEQISSLGSDDANVCKELLAIASVVYQPITLEELKSLAKSLTPDDYNDLPEIIRSCGAFLTLKDDTIYFVHQSAKDFLLKQTPSQALPDGIAHQHHAIFSQSLAAMSAILRRDIYGLRAPGFCIEEVSPPDNDPLASVGYSCVYWIDHCCDSYKLDSELLYNFLRLFSLKWLEALSLLRTIDYGIISVAKLRHIIKERSSNQNAVDLVQDLYRFIRHNVWVIKTYPLQTYVSALIFSPTECIIRKLFAHEEPQWITIKPVVEKTWGPCQQTFTGHNSAVTSVAFSSDSKLVASGSYDYTIKIWEAASGALQQTLKGHSHWVTSVAFSSDSKLVASGSNDYTIKIWEVTGALQQTLEGHSHWVTSVAFSPDSKLVASGSHDTTIKIWEAATGALQQTLKGHSYWVTSVAFSPDSKLVASGSDDTTIKIWEVTGALQQTLRGHSNWVRSVAFSPDSKLVASGSDDDTIKIWEVTGALQQTLRGHSNWVTSVVFSPDSKLVASGSYDDTIKIWEAATGALQQTLEGHSDWVRSVAFSPDSKLVASGSGDNTIKIWEVTGTLQQTLEGHSNLVASVVFSPDSKLVASGSYDDTIKIWEAATGALQQTLEGHSDWVRSVAFSPDSKLVASGSHDTTIKIWEAATGALQQTLKGHSYWVRSVAFSPDSKLVASGSGDNTIKIWEVTGTLQQTLEGHSNSVTSVAFSPDSKLVASGSGDKTIKIWEAVTGALQQTLEGHSDSVRSVAFSPDSKFVASGSDDNTIKIWEVTGTLQQTLEGHSGMVMLVTFSPDSKLVASGSYDDTIKVWEVTTGALQQTLQGHSHSVASVFLKFSSGTDQTNLDSYDVIKDKSWISCNDQQVLWLPPEYRHGDVLDISYPISSLLTSMTMIALGMPSGKVTIMGFSPIEPHSSL